MSTLDVLILLLLIWGVWKGYRRGFILQVVHLFGFLIATFVSFRYYREITPYVEAWIPYPFEQASMPLWLNIVDTEMLFYFFLAFVLLFFGTKLVLRLLAHLLNLVALLPGLNMANRWLGVVMGLAEVLLIIFVSVHLLNLLPWEKGQALLADSSLAIWFIEQTSFIFAFIQGAWLQ